MLNSSVLQEPLGPSGSAPVQLIAYLRGGTGPERSPIEGSTGRTDRSGPVRFLKHWFWATRKVWIKWPNFTTKYISCCNNSFFTIKWVWMTENINFPGNIKFGNCFEPQKGVWIKGPSFTTKYIICCNKSLNEFWW